MDDTKIDTRRIAAEAVGERPASATPDAAKEKLRTLPEEFVRPVPASAGPQASLAAKTAEAVGERVGDAYADATMAEAQRRSQQSIGHAATFHATVGSHWFGQQPLMTAAAGFALGYVAALMVHRSR